MNEEIDLLDLFFAFWKKRLWLVVALVIGAVFGFVYTKYIVTPKYTSSVTLLLGKSTESTNSTVIDSTGAITQSDIALNQKLISTYGEIMKSRRVCNAVIENLNLDMTYGAIIKCVDVSFVKDSDVIKLSITTTDPELAAKIANEMASVFTKEISAVYNIQNIFIIDGAEVELHPINVNFTKNIIIFALLAVVFVGTVIFFVYYFDNTVKSEDDVQKLTGLPVLSSIPKVESKKGGKAND